MSLSNAIQNTLRTAPYYDDAYATSNTAPNRGEEYDFLRILLRPGVGVQTRELTQLQTLLQKQVERLGNSEFRDGDAVTGGQITLDTSVTSGRTLASSNLAALFDRTTNSGRFIFDKDTPTTKAHVLQFLSADEGETSNSYVLFKYQSADAFLPNGIVQASDDSAITATFATGNTADVFSAASIASIDEGIFFVSGFFVRVPKQTIVLSPTTNRPSYRIGLTINEEILDELDETVGESLLDPANNGAPGAHRLRIRLTLSKKPLTSIADVGFIELARVVDGQVLQSQVTPKFVRADELNQILARRTYDEAGDYIVSSFAPVIETNPTDANTFVLSLGPGKAYVQGYEIQTTQPTKKVINKGRDTSLANNRSIPTTVGNFVYATRVAATEPLTYFANTAQVDLHCVNVATINTASSPVYTQSKIGTARVRLLETFSVPTDPLRQANNSVYKLFFYDVAFDNITGNVASVTTTGNATKLNIAVGQGIPAGNGTGSANDAMVGASVILGGASSPVSGTFTVNNFSSNSSIGIITLKEFVPIAPNANTTYKLVFQTKDIDAFTVLDANVAAMDAPYAAKFAFQADVDAQSKVGGVPTGFTQVVDSTDNVLLYQIPETFVVANTITTNTAVFKTWEKSSANARSISAASNVTVTLTVSGNNFSLPTGNLSATTAQDTLLIFDQTNDSAGHGSIIQFADSPAANTRCVSNVTITAVGQDYSVSFLYHHSNTTSNTRSFIALAKTTVTGMPVRTKTLRLGNTTTALANTTGALLAGQIEFYSLDVTSNFKYSLKTADVFRVRKVLYKSSNTAFSNTDMTTATDVTNLFTLDTGQRDNSYEYSQLVVAPGASATIRPTGRLLVIFDWFQHSGRGYASIDSYLSSVNIAAGMTYDLVPSYTSVKYNREVSLRDVLDFRPVRSNYEFLSQALVYAASDTSANSTYLTSASASYLIPVSDDVWLGSYQYYLSRIDKIGLFADGTFRVIEGQSSASPEAPSDQAGSLLLFQLRVPPYTLVDGAGAPEDVSLKTFDHKRYTMQDLSRLDDRVSHLEYYTALNSLEQITAKTPIFDTSDLERFKNGILVDTFLGGTVADVTRADYTASMDTVGRSMHPAFRSFALQFSADIANTNSTNLTVIGDMAIPAFNVAAFITQPLATHATPVNPFDVASFYGNVLLDPQVDIWKSVSGSPAQVVDIGGPNETWVLANTPSYLNWGEWDYTWSGLTNGRVRNGFFGDIGASGGNLPFSTDQELSWNDITTYTQYSQQGTSYEFDATTVQESNGNQTRNTSVIHHLRARDIIVTASSLKPGANIYPFFDGSAMISRFQRSSTLQLASRALTATSPFYVGQTVYVQKALSGTVGTTNGSSSIVGTSTAFVYELMVGTLLRITQGVNTFDAYCANVISDTSATLTTNASISLANAVVSTLTPVTITGVAPRITGSTVQYTISVARVKRDVDSDQAIPYPIVAGSLRPNAMVKDVANTTVGATLIVPASARGNSALQTMNIVAAVCVSGVVRNYTPNTGELRFDLDITDAKVATTGTPIYFVAGPGAGQQTTVVSYNASTQTAVVDTSSLSNIVAGQTLYSVGQPVAEKFISNSSVVAVRAGDIHGVLHVQDDAFAVGTRLVRLTDSANNIVADATTTAELAYVASGLTTLHQDVTIASREANLRRATPQIENSNLGGSVVNGFMTQYVDPMAETFMIDARTYPQGVFISSLDLCFAAVPVDDISVTVELRPVVNGFPSPNSIVPVCAPSGVAAATIRPDQITTTTNPNFTSNYTRITFDAPVHLLPGKEYAIVVRSDSSVYAVYTAEVGNTIIGSDAKVSKQPYAGRFFRPQNSSVREGSQTEDLMFRLNKCEWNASATVPLSALLVARAIAPDANTTLDSLEFYPHAVEFAEQTSMRYELDILPEGGGPSTRYIVLPNQWMRLNARATVKGSGGSIAANNVAGRPNPFTGAALQAANTIDAIVTLTTNSRDVAPYIDIKKTNVVGLRHLINNMGLDANGIVLASRGDGYLITLANGTITTSSGNTVIVGANTTFTTTIAVGDTFIVGGNVEVIVSEVTNNTQLIAATAPAVSRVANTWYTYGTLGGNNTIALTITGGNGTGANAYATVDRSGRIASVTFTSAGSGYTGTPTITAENYAVVGSVTQSLPSILYNSELYPAFGNGLTRYITKPVPLASGFEARDIIVIMDAYRPLGSNFHVYYKVLPTDLESVRFDDQSWRLMTMTTREDTISTSAQQFKEYQFETPNSRALDATSDNTDRFKTYAIKIVMAGTSTTDVPEIRNLRAIALDQ